MYTIWIDITNCLKERKTGVPKTVYNLAKNMVRLEEKVKIELIQFGENKSITCKREKEKILNG